MKKIQDYEKYETFILFGVSGSGKSSFVARLLSDLSPGQYFADVVERDITKKTTILVNGILIGKQMAATTVIPFPHNVSNFIIIDAPGFKDTNPNKNIIINIFHKCLLNKIKKCKYFIIVNINVLIEDGKNLASDYHKIFQNLFGSEYEKIINNLFFIFTHCDRMNILNREGNIESVINKRMIESMKLKDQMLVQFMSRMGENYMFFDYTTDDNNSLLKKINNLKQQNNQQNTYPNYEQQYFDVYTNELNRKANDDLTELITKYMAEFHLKIEKYRNDISELRSKKQIYDKSTYLLKNYDG